MTVANTLTYHDMVTFTSIKSFKFQATVASNKFMFSNACLHFLKVFCYIAIIVLPRLNNVIASLSLSLSLPLCLSVSLSMLPDKLLMLVLYLTSDTARKYQLKVIFILN